MAEVMADLVSEISNTTGTGAYNLDGLSSRGVFTFLDSVGDSNTCRYCVSMGDDAEIGIGTVTAGTPPTLSRDTILKSTNSNAAVDWGAGEKTIDLVANAALLSALLDVGTMANRDLTISTDEPSGGENGDVWYVVEA